MDNAELIDKVARILRLLQREFEQHIEEHPSPWVTDDVTRCRAACQAIDQLVPALRAVRRTQESADLLNPSPPCPDYDAF
ncbi:MAG: hypothetical protein ACJ8OJ_13040 [Povalibacter sp.]|jgi:hypothetical protein